MKPERKYDIMVVGSGAGLLIVENALTQGLSVALVDRGPFGGTCLNLGCIPSKMLIYPADRAVEIREAAKLGISATVDGVDFAAVMERMRTKISDGEENVRSALADSTGLDFYPGTGRFVDTYTLEVDGQRIRGKKIFLAAGARPHIPDIAGIEGIEYLTNETVLQLRQRPESIAIVGGGYIAAEYAHFFSAMGVRVTLLQRNRRLVPVEEPEISELLAAEMRKRMDVRTGTEVIRVKKGKAGYSVVGRDSSGGTTLIEAEQIMFATGRTSNADLLSLHRTGVELDDRGFVNVNEYFETSRRNIWAFGDIIRKKMFRHVANKEASLLWNNLTRENQTPMDYQAAPHAVFSYPEIASVGLTEEDARGTFPSDQLLVGVAQYTDVARGEAMMEENAFGKAIVTRDGRILGFHIVGPHASILIQEVVNAMANDLDIWSIGKAMHIHPALSEIVVTTLGNLEPLE